MSILVELPLGSYPNQLEIPPLTNEISLDLPVRREIGIIGRHRKV